MKWVFDKYLDQLAAMVVFGQPPQTIRQCKIREMIFDDDELDLWNLLQDYKNKKRWHWEGFVLQEDWKIY